MTVYMARCEADGSVKIGHSKQPYTRVGSVASERGSKMEVIRFLDGGYEDEQRLHKHFGKLWIQGEWFTFDQTLFEDVGLADLPLTKETRKSLRKPGTLYHLPVEEGRLLRSIAAAEDRTLQAVLRRALLAYAAASPEYQRAAPPGDGRKRGK